MSHSGVWHRIANEPATDEEIATHKRAACGCQPCRDKLRLIARIEGAQTGAATDEEIGMHRALAPTSNGVYVLDIMRLISRIEVTGAVVAGKVRR